MRGDAVDVDDPHHTHDCTGPDLTCPCGYVFRVPPVCVSIEISNGRTRLVNEGFNCESVSGAIKALRNAIAKLERCR